MAARILLFLFLSVLLFWGIDSRTTEEDRVTLELSQKQVIPDVEDPKSTPTSGSDSVVFVKPPLVRTDSYSKLMKKRSLTKELSVVAITFNQGVVGKDYSNVLDLAAIIKKAVIHLEGKPWVIAIMSQECSDPSGLQDFLSNFFDFKNSMKKEGQHGIGGNVGMGIRLDVFVDSSVPRPLHQHPFTNKQGLFGGLIGNKGQAGVTLVFPHVSIKDSPETQLALTLISTHLAPSVKNSYLSDEVKSCQTRLSQMESFGVRYKEHISKLQKTPKLLPLLVFSGDMNFRLTDLMTEGTGGGKLNVVKIAELHKQLVKYAEMAKEECAASQFYAYFDLIDEELDDEDMCFAERAEYIEIAKRDQLSAIFEAYKTFSSSGKVGEILGSETSQLYGAKWKLRQWPWGEGMKLAPLYDPLNKHSVPFPPTFKRVKNDSGYNDKRLPAWTDRCIVTDAAGMTIVATWSAEDNVQSDHKPVITVLKFTDVTLPPVEDPSLSRSVSTTSLTGQLFGVEQDSLVDEEELSKKPSGIAAAIRKLVSSDYDKDHEDRVEQLAELLDEGSLLDDTDYPNPAEDEDPFENEEDLGKEKEKEKEGVDEEEEGVDEEEEVPPTIPPLSEKEEDVELEEEDDLITQADFTQMTRKNLLAELGLTEEQFKELKKFTKGYQFKRRNGMRRPKSLRRKSLALTARTVREVFLPDKEKEKEPPKGNVDD